MPSWSKSVRLVTAIAVGLALTGCLKTEYSATVGANDTMTGFVQSYTPVSVLEQLESEDVEPGEVVSSWRRNTAKAVEDFSRDLGALSSPDEGTVVTASDISDEEIIGIQVSFENLPLPKRGAATTPGFLPGVSGLNLRRDGDLQIVSGTLGEKKPETVEQLAGSGVLQASLLQAQGQEPTVTVSFTFAGPIEETNGSVEGNTVTWTTAMFDPIRIEAKAAVPYQEGVGPVSAEGQSGGFSPMVVVTIGLLIAFAAAGTYVFLTGRKREQAEFEDDEYYDEYDDEYAEDELSWGEAEEAYEDEDYYEHEYDDYEDEYEEYEGDYADEDGYGPGGGDLGPRR
jgi:hypothetical protein